MNYAGFLRPVWWWLRDEGSPRTPFRFWDFPSAPLFGGEQTVASMRAFRAGVPWQSPLHSWTLLDSHDSPRFRTVTRSRERQLVGVGLQMTTPGVPMIFAGDELGLEGEWGEDARRTMPWDRPDAWDATLLDGYRRLDRASPLERRARERRDALRPRLRDAIAYVRETRASRCSASRRRAPHEPIRLRSHARFAELETLYGEDARVADGVLPADGPAFHVWRING